MKKIINTSIVFIISIIIFSFIGCNSKEPLVIKESDTYIVITVSNQEMEVTPDTTLVDYMNFLRSEGQLEFKIDNGMVNSVNGIDNHVDWSSCWMLYTNDSGSANSAWGSVEYKGDIYGSAILGAESLIIKDGCVYIWVFQSF